MNGARKRLQVIETLSSALGDAGEEFRAMPAYLQNLLLESLLTKALAPLKIFN